MNILCSALYLVTDYTPVLSKLGALLTPFLHLKIYLGYRIMLLMFF